jgi:hypothetical protein
MCQPWLLAGQPGALTSVFDQPAAVSAEHSNQCAVLMATSQYNTYFGFRTCWVVLCTAAVYTIAEWIACMVCKTLVM